MPQLDELMDRKQNHDGEGSRATDDTVIASLLYEQGRLRADLDRLRSDQTDTQERLRSEAPSKGNAAKDQPAEEKGKADEKTDVKPNAEPKPNAKPTKKEGEDGGDAGEDGGKDAPKEPFFKRMTGWAKTHPITTVFIPILFVAAIVGGWFLWGYLQSYESTDDAQVDGHLNAISSRIAGTVVAVYIENNQNLTRGKLAVDLDPRDNEVALAQQRANLAQAVANLNAQNPSVPITQLTQQTGISTADLDVTSAEAGYLSQQQQAISALADLRQAEANAANSAAEEMRYRMLVEKQEVSREQYDQRASDLRAQNALVSSRAATADAARKTVDQRKAAVQQAISRANQAKQNSLREVAVQRATLVAREAAAQISKAQVDQALLNLTYCKIYAPVNGIVGNKTVEIGAQVSVGQELFDVTPIDDLWVTANYKETQLRKMRPGQSVTVHVDTLGRDFNGYIEDMPGATGAIYSLLPPENATGNYVKVVQRLPVRIRFKPSQDGLNRLRTGMSVEPKVWLQ